MFSALAPVGKRLSIVFLCPEVLPFVLRDRTEIIQGVCEAVGAFIVPGRILHRTKQDTPSFRQLMLVLQPFSEFHRTCPFVGSSRLDQRSFAWEFLSR